jgi:hypothetical protein
MRRDLRVMEQICYLGKQEIGRTPAPQLEAVSRLVKTFMKTLLGV